MALVPCHCIGISTTVVHSLTLLSSSYIFRISLLLHLTYLPTGHWFPIVRVRNWALTGIWYIQRVSVYVYMWICERTLILMTMVWRWWYDGDDDDDEEELVSTNTYLILFNHIYPIDHIYHGCWSTICDSPAATFGQVLSRSILPKLRERWAMKWRADAPPLCFSGDVLSGGHLDLWCVELHRNGSEPHSSLLQQSSARIRWIAERNT